MNYEKNKLYSRAKSIIPGGYLTASKSPLRFPEHHPIYAAKGDGCYLYDVNGNKYIDYVQALGTQILGYNYPKVIKEVKNQLNKGNLFSLESELMIKLSDTLGNTIPSAELCKFFKNGSDSTAAALKVARAFTGKNGVVMFNGNYHGNADVFTIHQDIHYGVPDINKQVSYCIEPDIEVVKTFLDTHEDIACVITEPVTYEDRYKFLAELKSICEHKGIVLIFDEIVTHLRDSIGGTQDRYGIIPDLTTVSKGMSCGFPISALVGKEDIMSCFDVDNSKTPCFYSGSFHGDAISMVAADACINECIDKKVPDHIYERGSSLKEAFNKLSFEKCLPIGMHGLPYRMILKYRGVDSIDANDIKSFLLQELAERGIIVGNIIYCGLKHDKHIIDETISICDEVLDLLALSIENGTVTESIIGRGCKDLVLRKT